MQYLVSVIDDGQARAAQRSDSATAQEEVAIDRFNERLQAEGHWVFAGGLGFPTTATTVDNRDGEAMFTDGPFVETKEYLAGLPRGAVSLRLERGRLPARGHGRPGYRRDRRRAATRHAAPLRPPSRIPGPGHPPGRRGNAALLPADPVTRHLAMPAPAA